MAGFHKRFDPALHAENDEKCRASVKRLLTNTDFYVIDNPKVRGVDLLLHDKDGIHIGYIEVERKTVWKEAKFPYENVNFPERKGKMAKLDKPTIFVMFNEDMSNFLAVRGSDLLASPLEEVNNKYVYKGEMFFKVSLDKANFNSIVNLLEEIKNGK